ncbi:MAG: SPFH domain-containing protein [Taibaiella sp.]|nr:SPFH domain-containing protein [Taibaiella sp.]
MGLFEKLRHELIDIVEWPEQDPNLLVWKFPTDNEIKMGAKLTVREGQQAVFLNKGQIADVFQPGMYTLHTQNMPILSKLLGWQYGFDSPFRSEVFFVSTRQAIDQKWGTKNSITISDARFGLIEFRAFGTYAFKVADAGKFLQEVAGVAREYTTDEIGAQIRSIIVSHFTSAATSGNLPIDKLAGSTDALSSIIQDKLVTDFTEYGLQIKKFVVENVSLPDDLKKEIFEYSRINTIDIQKYTQWKVANSIETAAANPGMTGASIGIGVGLGYGNILSNAFNQANQKQQEQATMPPPLTQYFTAADGKQNGPYDAGQIQQMMQAGTIVRETLVWKAGMAAWGKAETVAELADHFNNVPPPIQ